MTNHKQKVVIKQHVTH